MFSVSISALVHFRASTAPMSCLSAIKLCFSVGLDFFSWIWINGALSSLNGGKMKELMVVVD